MTQMAAQEVKKAGGLAKARLAGWGFAISALGTLPLGTLNVAAMQVSIAEGWRQGMYFSIGVAIVEVLYVRLSLVGIQWIRQRAKLLRAMDWVALLIVLALAAGSFYAAAHPTAEKSFLLQTSLPLFWLGFTMSAVNPVQIPFWFGWSTILFSKGVLHARRDYYNWYTVGIGLGTMTGLALFVFGGALLVERLNANQSVVNYAIGGVFTITAIIQLARILRNRTLDRQIEDKGAILEEAELRDEAAGGPDD